jgi:protocatechuate 3,4-dioxygenase beta subunit
VVCSSNIATATTPAAYTVSGIVITTEGNPLSGAVVSIGSQSATTGADGRYVILDVPPGTYAITATKEGWRIFGASSVTVPPNATANFTARPDETGNRLSGVVVTTDGSDPSGVTASIGGLTAVTDASGRYTITGLAPGTYPISASKPG